MNLKELKTIAEVSKSSKIPLKTLQSRLKNLIEDEDYLKLGERMPTILTPQGVKKITGGKEEC